MVVCSPQGVVVAFKGDLVCKVLKENWPTAALCGSYSGCCHPLQDPGNRGSHARSTCHVPATAASPPDMRSFILTLGAAPGGRCCYVFCAQDGETEPQGGSDTFSGRAGAESLVRLSGCNVCSLPLGRWLSGSACVSIPGPLCMTQGAGPALESAVQQGGWAWECAVLTGPQCCCWSGDCGLEPPPAPHVEGVL